jgi:hypothetical protein
VNWCACVRRGELLKHYEKTTKLVGCDKFALAKAGTPFESQMVNLKWIEPQVISGPFPNGHEFRCLQPSGSGLQYLFLSRRGGYRSSSGRRSRNKLRCVLFIPTQTALAGIEKNRQDAASENE